MAGPLGGNPGAVSCAQRCPWRREFSRFSPDGTCELRPNICSFRPKGPVESEGWAGTARRPAIRIFARDEIVVPIPTYERLSGPDAKSGADQDDCYRHRQAHGERAANRQGECGKQICRRPQAVYRHASFSTNRKVKKPSPGRSGNGFLARAHCPEAPRARGASRWLTKY